MGLGLVRCIRTVVAKECIVRSERLWWTLARRRLPCVWYLDVSDWRTILMQNVFCAAMLSHQVEPSHTNLFLLQGVFRWGPFRDCGCGFYVCDFTC